MVEQNVPILFAICRLRHAHVRKDTRLSLLFRTARNEKLVGAGERGYAHICMTSQMLNELTVSLSSLSLVLDGAAVGYSSWLPSLSVNVCLALVNLCRCKVPQFSEYFCNNYVTI